MLTRRSFLSALCALPFVGKFIPKPDYGFPPDYADALKYSIAQRPLYPTQGGVSSRQKP